LKYQEKYGKYEKKMGNLSENIKIHFLAKINKCLNNLKSARLPSSLKEIPYDKFFTLEIPTYENSGQAVHPDILHQNSMSPPFLLALTPYPFSIDRFENPSILASNDGLRFFEEYPGSNPLVCPPPYDHNNDPCIFYYDGKLRIMYLETLRPEKQNIVLLTHQDGARWISQNVHTDYINGRDPMILSPVYVRINQKDFLFYVNLTRHKIQFVPLRHNFIPDCSQRKDISINMAGLDPWHIDIVSHEGTFYMLICCVKTEKNKRIFDLYTARSSDGYTWDFSTNKLINNSYRATGFFIDDDMYIYYSRQTWFFLSWELGIIKKRFLNFFD
jgi:hypothetical protein